MNEEKKDKKEVMEVVCPPQSSLKLVSHGRDDGVYYTWEIKCYCDNLDSAFVELCCLDKKLKDKYGYGKV